MDLLDALKQRKSVREFLYKEVEEEKLEAMLNMAKLAPSGVNMQPWNVAVVSGQTKQNIENEMVQRFNDGVEESMEYNYYPTNWIEPFKTRRKETGLQMYETLDIKREDKEKQHKQWEKNYRAFGAPVVMYFFIDENLEKGSYMDYGMFLQSLMLSATALGLGTCTQAALAQYPDVIKKELGIEPNMKLLCGMAIGYEDKDALINSYRTPRINIEKFATFYK